MSDDLDVLTEEFARRLGAIQNKSLEQWQFAFRKVMLSMSVNIFEKFPTLVIGRDPCLPQVMQGGGSAGGGAHPPPPPPPPCPPPIVIINGQQPPYHTFGYSQAPPYHTFVVAGVALSNCPDCPK